MPDVPEQPIAGILVPAGLGLALFGGIWLLFAVPWLRGLVVGLRTRDWWTPFAQRPDGRYGVLARSHFLAAFRAPERRSTRGLAVRWLVWTFVVVALAAYPLQIVVDAVRLLRR